MGENVIKLNRSEGFTVLQNALLRDARLSLKTKGLFAVLASLPPNWEYSVSGLIKVTGAGKDAIGTALKELEKAGYLERRQRHGGDGKFSGYTYEIYDEPEVPPEGVQNWPLAGKPSTEKPTTEKPSTGNPPQYKKDLIQERNINTPYIPPQGDVSELDTVCMPKWKPERFAGFWAYYPRHVKRDRAVRAWDRLKPSDSLIDAMGRALRLQVHYWSATNTEKRYIPHASTWLNSKSWEDDPADYAIPTSAEVSAGWAADPEVM